MHLHLFATLIALTVSITQGRINVQLSESDYAVQEDNPVLSVLVLIEGTHSDSVTLQIIPLTFAMYQTQFPDLPCSRSVEDLLGGQNEAESSDFNTTVIETVLGPNILELTSSTGFNVPLISDSKLENVEVFLVLLNVISTEDVTIGRRCAIGRLLGSLDPDQDVIRLDPHIDHIELQEHAGTVHLFNITKIVETELTICITIEIRNTPLNADLMIVPSATLEIAPETSSISVRMTIVDDFIAEDSETTELRVRASVANTPISQEFQTLVTIHDNEVVTLGFVGTEERTVVEGRELEICADLVNVTILNFLRFEDEFRFSTADETATAGEDYTALSEGYQPIIGLQCFTLQTMDNDRIEEPRVFTVNFASGFTRDSLTVIQPSSIRVVLMDDDALPQAPMIDSVTSNKILTVTWTANPTPTQPINGFFGNITVGDRVIEFNVTNTTQNHTLEDFQEEKTHVIVVCAENVNGRTCSSPYKVEPPSPPSIVTPGAGGLTGATNAPAKLPPGLIAGIVVIAAALLCCCLLLLFFSLCLYCRADREKTYWPAKSEGKQIRGRSPDSNYSADEDNDSSFFESDLQKAPL